MGIATVFETVFPVFILVAVGYGFGGLRRLDLFSLTEIVVYLGGPALVFTSLAGGSMEMREVGLTAVGTIFIITSVGAGLWVFSRLSGLRIDGLYLPAMFMNAGNMLLPLALFAFGEDGLRYAVVVFATATLLQSSLGVAIASGRPRVAETFKLPYVYAAVLGLSSQYAAAQTPSLLMRPLELLAGLAIPLMLLSLGVRLRSIEFAAWQRPLFAASVRLGGGYVAGWSFVTLSGVSGTSREVLLLASVMPAAVINFVFAEKYSESSGDVAGAVLASTLLSAAFVPLVLTFGL